MCLSVVVSQIRQQEESQGKHNQAKSVPLRGGGRGMPCLAIWEDFGEKPGSRSEGKAETKTLYWNFQRKAMAGQGRQDGIGWS